MFRVEIELGNAEMQTPHQVAEALRRLADRLEQIDGHPGHGTIRDTNGNATGMYDWEGRAA